MLLFESITQNKPPPGEGHQRRLRRIDIRGGLPQEGSGFLESQTADARSPYPPAAFTEGTLRHSILTSSMTVETRTAIVELLLLAPYLDSHLSLAEDAALERALKAIGWSASRRGDVSLTAAFAAAREAGSCELKTRAFMEERAAVIKAEGLSSVAFEWLGKVLGSDGVSGSENSFLARAKRLLFD